MRLVCVTAPTEDLVSLADARAHLRVDDNDSDDLISSLVAAATQHLDGYSGVLGRALAPQTWRVDVSGPSCGTIRLNLPPVREIVSVKYVSAGEEVTLAPAAYRLGEDELSAFVTLNEGYCWPSTDCREDAWRVTFAAGYADAASVPEPIKQAIKLLVGHWYRNREGVNVGNIVTTMPLAVEALTAPYRVWCIP